MNKHLVDVYSLTKTGVSLDDLRLLLMGELREIREKLLSEEKPDSEKIESLDRSLYNLTDKSLDITVNVPLYEGLHNCIYLNENVYEFNRSLEPVEFDKPCRRFDVLSDWEGINEESEIVKITPYGFSSNNS